MLRCIPPSIDRNGWLTVCGALVVAPVDDLSWNGLEAFIRWSRGDLHDAITPANFKGVEDCEAQWARDIDLRAHGKDVPAFGALVNLARSHGYEGRSDNRPASEVFKEYLSAHHAPEPSADAVATGAWCFGLHDPEADATLPPITYRDKLKLWPDSPGKTVTAMSSRDQRNTRQTGSWRNCLFRWLVLTMTGRAKVLMLALEGSYGVRTMRLKALARHYGVPLGRSSRLFPNC